MAELRAFVFSDLVGSVDLKGEMPGGSDAERDAAFVAEILSPHRERIEGFARDFGGRVVSTAGDGHFLVFDDVTSAARWGIATLRSHADEPIATPQGNRAEVRISLHVGAPQVDPQDPHNFVGRAVDYAARLVDIASGGQILLSRAALAILEDAGLSGVKFHGHGKRELKGIGEVEVHELLFDGRSPRSPRPAPREERSREWTTVLHASDVVLDEAARGGNFPGQHNVAATKPRQVGNYVLGELVGAGGMGEVFKAKHVQFGRQRAVKVIKPHLVGSGQTDVVRRFYQEIKAIGALEHPNIVVAIDSSSPTDETHYLVMEYVDGVSAGDVVERRGPLSIANACEVARQTALGLEYIHRQGMVHRDIKPSNLMLTVVEPTHLTPVAGANDAGDEKIALVKILDLGLALLVGDDHERLTRLDHRAMGTAMYMSPEQWKTTSVDIRSDIYSLGCTMYHLLAGEPPFFTSELRPEVAHHKERVPAIRSGEQLPKGLWRVLQRAMAKSPDERFATPAELAEALAPYAAGNTLAEVVEECRRRKASQTTQGGQGGETRAGTGADVETRLGSRRPGSTLTAAARQSWPWLATMVVLAGLAALWGVWFAGSRRNDSSELLHVAAKLASDRVEQEISSRFRLLRQGSRDIEGFTSAASADPDNETLWQPLQSWGERQKLAHDADARSESWFVLDAGGTQIARAPYSDTVGRNFAFRAYYHGGASDLEEGSRAKPPIRQPNHSAVYRSNTTGRLKVAFSVPVWNGESGDRRDVAGVLAMSVDLGDFRVLDAKDLREDKEVLLIDLRNDQIAGEDRRGLILHHRQLGDVGPNRPPPRLAPELVERIDQLLAEDRGVAPYKEKLLRDYRDPLGRSNARYWGAVEPVVIDNIGGDRLETEWVVLVQEEMR